MKLHNIKCHVQIGKAQKNYARIKHAGNTKVDAQFSGTERYNGHYSQTLYRDLAWVWQSLLRSIIILTPLQSLMSLEAP